MVVAIVGTLASVAAPSLRQWYDDARVDAHLGRLASTLSVARSAALKFGSTVVLCASRSGTDCDGDWSQGWMVFRDDDADGGFTAMEPVLLVERGTDRRIAIGMSGQGSAVSRLAFNSRGYPDRAVLVTGSRGRISSQMNVTAIGRTLRQ